MPNPLDIVCAIVYSRIFMFAVIAGTPLSSIWATLRMRGFRLVLMLSTIAFVGYVLLCVGASVKQEAYAAKLPPGAVDCGMGPGLMVLYGWMLPCAMVVGSAALTFATLGVVKLGKTFLAFWRKQHAYGRYKQ